MKRIPLIALSAVLVFALMGCNVTRTETKTEIITDASGKTTTTTTTIKNENGVITEKTETIQEEATEPGPTVATVSFENNTGEDIYGMYFSSAKEDNWGDNILGDDPLEDGFTAVFHDALTYSSDNTLWDLRTVDKDGAHVDFTGFDLSAVADPEDITFILTHDTETDTYSATVQ